MPLCQICKKNAATVHVTEITYFPVVEPGEDGGTEPQFEQKHVCEQCAARGNIPYAGVIAESKGLAMLAMLKASARRVRDEGQKACPECGMTLAEFRSKGRLGCPRDYEVFAEHLRPLLLRMHNATRHTTQVARENPTPKDDLKSLRAQLEEAIRAEAYENAAKLRDQIEEIEKHPHGDG
ncbi:MAG TPA: hypothetical protein ENJ09_11375 [Planctomycetes bacterium]|nr:hypothetical protein [Planctomycetota bacterium]